MSSETISPQDDNKIEVEAPPKTPTESNASATRKRPRLDLNAAAGDRERKRGKSMFGLLVGTLNKAKLEDKERNASEAAKKRQLIEQRLQIKLRKETDSVRRAEEAKKEKTTANRKEEELQLKDSIYKLRRTRFPILANFLSTADTIPPEDSEPLPPPSDPLSQPPRSHPPPLYYLPAVLLPSQAAFITRRKAEVQEAAEKEWQAFREERVTGTAEINTLRERVAEEESRQKSEKVPDKEDMDTDSAAPASAISEDKAETTSAPPAPTREAEMEVDDSAREEAKEPSPEKKDEPSSMQADDDDAVEY